MMTAVNSEQSIGLTGIQNARELGGYKTDNGKRVKKGVLLRTAKLSTGTADDLRRLREDFHLAKIVDFRSDEEVNGYPETMSFAGNSEPDPDPEIEGAEYFHLSVLDIMNMYAQMSQKVDLSTIKDFISMLETSIRLGIIGENMYIGFLEEPLGRQSYSRFFRELLSLDEGRSILFHCTQGKDRTGVAAMLILSVLGVPEETVISDYMLTNRFNAQRIEGERRMLEKTGKIPPEKIDVFLMAMDKVSENTMKNVIGHLKDKYGSAENYVTQVLGVTEAEIEALKNKFLE